MFGPPDDEDSCPHCGCAMEVIGPPGPSHAYDCPVSVEGRKRAAKEKAETDALIGNYKCGCVVTGRGIEKPCFKANCELLRTARRKGFHPDY